MIRRLVEQSYYEHSAGTSQELVRFWLRELRTPELLVEVARAHPELARVRGRVAPSGSSRAIGAPGGR